MDDEIITLVKKKKTGLMRIIFSRLAVISVLIIIEGLLIFSLYRWFSSYFKYFYVVEVLFSAAMVIYLFNSRMDASVKLTWMFLIALFPIPAALLLFYTRADVGHRYAVRLLDQSIESSNTLLVQDEEVLQDEKLIESGTVSLYKYLSRSGCCRIYKNTEVKYFPLGEEMLAAMLKELNKAEKFIFLEYFIIDEGYMWGRILKILADKVRQGVDVRVMYDGMCEVSLLPHDYPQRMAKLGIKCAPFTPIRPFISTQYNYRDHRKIMVIDGRTAINGGINLADEYINKKQRFGHWKDTAVQLTGDAVQSYTLMFLQMWNADKREPDWSEALLSCKAANPSGYVIPYGDSPMKAEKLAENVYIDILARAKTYVYIMTPYLILDNELENALKYAAQRGVDVKIILPGIPDKKGAYALAKTHYPSLLDAGVQLYEYTPGFVHAKVFVSDDEKAVVGTINLDYRSLYHHFECAAYMYKTSCIADIESDFENTLVRCRRVTYQTVKEEKILYKLTGRLLKSLAPLM